MFIREGACTRVGTIKWSDNKCRRDTTKRAIKHVQQREEATLGIRGSVTSCNFVLGCGAIGSVLGV